MSRLVKFKVLGQEYPLYTDAPEEDINEILDIVKNQLEVHLHTSAKVLPGNKLAILTSLNVASEYVKLKKDFEQYKNSLAETVARLAQKVDSAL